MVVPLPIGVIMVVLTMFARIYYMCHYPTDTIVGAAIGVYITLVLNWICS